ncbi:tRNA-guanine transglycosylase DpdA [Coraliomargarita sp. SDUM461003]|uniref:tRNA-guanine transglycosylase DpdA n=1 Tax=Thalassobacterium maritimum TaxID=3041265 RepID=A0ABU1AUR0_9BACT|nr:tRNA-guanine transglycosylase DpdA [Coraliomargarita sp. SDUM461003]MDQ8206855.1 tRNA-guanine transglycosylase DpdA [Coraliomargarita sp. SDUM461003]
MIQFYFPDSVDVINPGYCFDEEEHDRKRKRIVSEAYPHEVYEQPPYDGMLISKAVVKTRYSMAQRQRLMRQGIRKFLRLDTPEREHIKVIGDCGAFTYRNDPEPPYSVDEVIDFYDDLGFDLGISLDHVILGFEDEDESEYKIYPDSKKLEELAEFKRRQDTTLRLAKEFLESCISRKVKFKPLGVAQGWSPSSYADAVEKLQEIGYDYIALGGMVPLKTDEIESCLRKIEKIRKKDTKFHLLGISRIDELREFEKFGVVSADSTAPLLQAFKSDRDNFQLNGDSFIALRVQQVGENNKVKKLVLSGAISQDEARKLELDCMRLLKGFDQGTASVEEVTEALCQLEALITQKPKIKNRPLYVRTLKEKPWRNCDCPICKELGIHVVIFRGAERNRRRGFHNLYNYYSILKGKRTATTHHV